jgi:anti-sigma regulatory factor (Ser/Thr protein kinase)
MDDDQQATPAEPQPHAELRFRVEPVNSNLSIGRHIIATMAQRCSPRDRDVILLVASELLANAVQHAATCVEARIEFHGDYIRIDVLDDGDGWPRLRHVDPLSETGGRGLSIVDRLSTSWGVEDLIPGKQVWSIITSAVNSRPSALHGYAAAV